MVIDAHSHWLPEEIINNAHFFHKGWSDIEAQLKMMDEQGLSQAILSYPSSDAHLKLGGYARVARIFNDSVARVIKRYPDRFIGAAILPVEDAQAMPDELKRARDLGFRAISLASSYNGIYLDDARFLPIYKKAEAEGIPIFVHSQIVNPIGFERVEDPLLTPVIEYVFDTTICIGKLLMSGILRDYNLKFIFGYFGGVTPFLAHRFEATYQMLRGVNFVKDLKGSPREFLRKIYVDTSGDTTAANFQAALDLFGPAHVLWGSDWPGKKDVAGGIRIIRELGLSEDETAGILGSNLSRLF